MRLIRTLLAAAALTTLFVGVASAEAASASPHPAARSAAVAVLSLINRDRASHGAPALRLGGRVDRVALAHSLEMARHDYFSHTGLNGSTPLSRLAQGRVPFSVAGENLGYDSGASRPAMLREIEAAMMNSPDHRANLLDRNFKHVGIGIAEQGQTIYVTEDFTG
jgi:uncharacterized protein YkwD